MGQSMQQPDKTQIRDSRSRLSARSLQRISRHSMAFEKKASLSASKLHHNSLDDAVNKSDSVDNTQIRQGQLHLLSTYGQIKKQVPETDHLKVIKTTPLDTSQASPKFHDFVEQARQYGLGQWGGTLPLKKHNDTSVNDSSHRDITISFSKTKNNFNNVFQEEPSQRKSNLQQILQESQEIVNNIRAEISEYPFKEIQKISATRSICQDSVKGQKVQQKLEKTPKKVGQTVVAEAGLTKRKKDITKSSKMIETKEKDTLKQQIQIVAKPEPVVNNVQYNDYDRTDFLRKPKDDSSRKNFRMSKKMQELKQKIASRALNNSNSSRQDAKGNSLSKRLSNSFRQRLLNRSKGQSLRGESKDRSERLTQTQFINITISGQQSRQEYQLNQTQENLKNKKEICILQTKQKEKSKIKKDKNIHHKQQYAVKKMKSNEHLGKTNHSSKHSSNQIHLKSQKQIAKVKNNEKNAYVTQNVLPSNKHQAMPIEAKVIKSHKQNKVFPKGMQTSFTEMIKKQHFNYKNQKKITEQQPIKYSQIEAAKVELSNQQLFASTCNKQCQPFQQYNIFDYRDEKKSIKNQQINSLKKITQKLNSQQTKPKRQKQKHSNHPINKTALQLHRSDSVGHNTKSNYLNNTHLICNQSQYMLKQALKRQKQGKQYVKEQKQKRRYRSSDNSRDGSKFKSSKLIIF